MTWQTVLVFVPACFALNMAFGPNNLLSLTVGARHGVRAAVLSSSGRLVAFAGMILIAALGMGAVLSASEVLFTALKICGAAYLCWMGLRLLRSEQVLSVADPTGSEEVRLWPMTRREFLVAAGNPKAIVIFTAFFPQFVADTAYWRSFAVLGAIFLVLEVAAIAAYAGIGARLLGRFRGERAGRWVNRASGGMMMAFGALLALSRRPV